MIFVKVYQPKNIMNHDIHPLIYGHKHSLGLLTFWERKAKGTVTSKKPFIKNILTKIHRETNV